MEIISNLLNYHFDSSELSSPNSATIPSPSSISNLVPKGELVVMLASSNPKKRAGRIRYRETRHPVYRGVRLMNSGKWVCEVREPNKKSRIWLGTYETADMAARAHDVATLALRGRAACLNFADSTWRLPIPASSHVKDIQRAAAEAAEMFGPNHNDDDDDEVDDHLVVEIQIEALVDDVFYSNQVDQSDYTADIFPEIVFGMPEMLASMAEGLMLPPPRRQGSYFGVDDVEITSDMSLWN